MVGGLDSFQGLPGVFDSRSDPWARALAIDLGGCWSVPRGPGHGYPNGEVEYQLGVAAGEVPEGIGIAYGSEDYRWLWGDASWYGHDGIGSGWIFQVGAEPPLQVEARVEYDEASRMRAESAVVVTAEGAEVEVDRARILHVDGWIESDTLSVVTADGRHERALSFAHEAGRGLSRRALVADGEVVEAQTWRRDERGRVLLHRIEDGQPATSWSWAFDGDLLVHRAGGPEQRTQTLSYDGQDRLVEVTGLWVASDPSAQRWAFDAEDRVAEHCVDRGQDTTCTTNHFDAAGRLTRRETTRDAGEAVVTQLNIYSCAL
jgi:hypothetical protein